MTFFVMRKENNRICLSYCRIFTVDQNFQTVELEIIIYLLFSTSREINGRVLLFDQFFSKQYNNIINISREIIFFFSKKK
jgi:hypothetical protein